MKVIVIMLAFSVKVKVVLQKCGGFLRSSQLYNPFIILKICRGHSYIYNGRCGGGSGDAIVPPFATVPKR